MPDNKTSEQSKDVQAAFGTQLPKPPSKRQQSWGAVISIVVIMLMIIIGAFYSWGKRIAEQKAFEAATADQTAL
jgi:hypothetical protein